MRKTIVEILGGIISIALMVLLIQLALATRPAAGGQVPPSVTPDPVVEALQARYDELGVPVKEIRLVERSPLNVEITLQSASEGDKTTMDDLWWFFLAEREADMIYLTTGEHISSYTLNVLNTQGESIRGIISLFSSLDKSNTPDFRSG
jgi:hypothetical protein